MQIKIFRTASAPAFAARGTGFKNAVAARGNYFQDRGVRLQEDGVGTLNAGSFSRLLARRADASPRREASDSSLSTSAASPQLDRGGAVFIAQEAPPGAVPYGHGAGFRVPPGTANGPIVADEGAESMQIKLEDAAAVQTPVAAAVETPVAPGPTKKPQVTLDDIVLQYRKTLRQDTHRHIYLGGLIHSWLVRQPERSEQLPRAAAMIVIENRIAAEGLAGVCRPHRDLKCFHAARLLGGDADGVQISAIYHLLKLVERQSDRWRLVPEHEAATRALWSRMLAEHLSAEAVRGEVAKILPPPQNSPPLRSRQIITLLRLVPSLSAGEIEEAIKALKTAKGKLQNAKCKLSA